MNTDNDKTVLITGGTGGIGLQSAKGIAKSGARILITGRNLERGTAAVQNIISETGNEKVELVIGNVSSNRSVDDLAAAVLAKASKIDVLINNAGYLGNSFQKNEDGVELHFAVNVLAPWRLTNALLPAFKAAQNPRVLNITGGDKPAPVDPDNLQAEKGFRGLMTYAHSKSVLEAMSMTLAKELASEGVAVNVLFPGRAATAMSGSLRPSSLPGGLKLMYPLFKFMFREDGGKSAKRAAQSSIWGATTDDLIDKTGRFFDTNCQEQELHPTVYDSQVQNRILSVIKAAQAA